MSTKSFNNKKIVITRPAERSEALAKIVTDHDGEPIIIPTLELQLVRSKELEYIANNISDFEWIIFTSPAGVKSFFSVYESNNIPCKIAVIGVKTEEELLKHDNKPDIIPDNFSAEGLIESFKSIDIKDKCIALPRTLSARTVLPNALEEYGAKVYIAEAYTSAIPKDRTDIIKLSQMIIDSEVDIITFTSPLTVRNLIAVVKEEEPEKLEEFMDALKNKITVASIGPITGNVLHEYGIDPIEPDRYTVKDMMDAILEKGD